MITIPIHSMICVWNACPCGTWILSTGHRSPNQSSVRVSMCQSGQLTILSDDLSLRDTYKLFGMSENNHNNGKAAAKPSYGTSSSSASPASRKSYDRSPSLSSSSNNINKSPQTPKLQRETEKEENSNALYLSFVAMVIVGVGNQIFGKLQTLPM